MSQLSLAKFTAAKICHELANHLSAVQFVCEDLVESSEETKELLHSIRLLSLTLRFFRNIYAISGHTESLYDIMFDIALSKQIVIKDEDRLLIASNIDYNRERVICGLLYIASKSCKSNDEMIISDDDGKGIIVRVKNKDRMLPSDIENAFRHNVKEDSVNVFAIYLKHLATSVGLVIGIEPTDECPITMRVWEN